MSIDMYLPAFPAVADAYGAGTDTVRLTMASFLVGLACGQLLWGPLSDRHGRKRPLLFGLGLYVVASLLIAVCPTMGMLIGLRFVQAVGAAAALVIARALVRDLYSGQQLARVLSLITIVFGLAPIVAPLTGSVVLLAGSWPWVFVVLALFGLACLWGSAALPETLPAERRSRHDMGQAVHQYAEILGDVRFRYAAAVAGLGSVSLLTYVSSASVVIVEAYGQTPSTFAWVFAGLSIAITLGAQVNLRLLRTHRAASLMRAAVVSQLAGTLALLAAALSHAPFWVFLLPLVITLTTFNGVNGNGLALALDPFPRAAASAAALLGAIQTGLGGIAAALQAVLPTWAPVGMSLVMAAAATVGVIVLAANRKLHHRLV